MDNTLLWSCGTICTHLDNYGIYSGDLLCFTCLIQQIQMVISNRYTRWQAKCHFCLYQIVVLYKKNNKDSMRQEYGFLMCLRATQRHVYVAKF